MSTAPSTAPSSSASLSRTILALAIPALGALVAEPLFTVIDSAMVGHLGTAQLAGLSLGSQILQTVIAAFIFLAYSTTSLTARALGAGDMARAVRSGVNASWLAAGLGIGAGIGIAILTPFLTAAMTSSPEIAAHANAFLWASTPGIAGTLLTFSIVGTLRGLQDMRTPLVVTTVGTIANIGINALFIFGFGWGIVGSGLGTSLALIVMAGVYLSTLVRLARAEGVALHPRSTGIWHAAADGAPLIIRGLALRAAGLATIWPAGQLGAGPLAGYQVVLAVWTLTSFILDALAIAAQSLIGEALGRGDRTRLRALLRALTVWGAGAGVVLGGVVAAASPWLPRLFGADPAMWSVATWGLLGACVGMPFAGVVFMLDGALLGAGDNRYFAVAGIAQLIVYLPVLALVDVARRSGASPQMVIGGVWLAYSLAYMGARLATNSWRTWRSARALVPRAD